ncbi:hypothetical protein ACIN8IBEIGE_50057 [Acinetobacter sp. 8I-beige]|nr:hypothetical protein ACIN8IBEIGE_50057 [Acinetobacter sp. 8I-beige]
MMPIAQHFALIFRTRYAYTPTELKANAAMNAIYANNRYRYTAMKLLKSTRMANSSTACNLWLQLLKME